MLVRFEGGPLDGTEREVLWLCETYLAPVIRAMRPEDLPVLELRSRIRIAQIMGDCEIPMPPNPCLSYAEYKGDFATVEGGFGVYRFVEAKENQSK